VLADINEKAARTAARELNAAGHRAVDVRRWRLRSMTALQIARRVFDEAGK
jgi:hypothetical protein